MNRWPFSSEASKQQASERDQRAARKTLREQQLLQKVLSDSDDEDNFKDAEYSFSAGLNLDGEPEDEIAEMDAAALAAERQKPFDGRNLPDDDEAWKKEIKIKFDINDVKYWFNSVEGQMRKFGINQQC